MSAQLLVNNILARTDEDVQEIIDSEEYTILCFICKFGQITNERKTDSLVVIMQKDNLYFGAKVVGNITCGKLVTRNVTKIHPNEHKRVFIN